MKQSKIADKISYFVEFENLIIKIKLLLHYKPNDITHNSNSSFKKMKTFLLILIILYANINEARFQSELICIL